MDALADLTTTTDTQNIAGASVKTLPIVAPAQNFLSGLGLPSWALPVGIVAILLLFITKK